jgi:hypothetical protein
MTSIVAIRVMSRSNASPCEPRHRGILPWLGPPHAAELVGPISTRASLAGAAEFPIVYIDAESARPVRRNLGLLGSVRS